MKRPDHSHLPDPLIDSDEKPVQSPEVWHRRRRKTLLNVFRSQVFGHNPVERPDSLTFAVEEILPDALGGRAEGRIVKIGYAGPGGEGAVRLSLFVPKEMTGPAPVFLLICNRSVEDMSLERKYPSPFWPVEQIVAHGYAAAAFQVADVDPDDFDDFQNGVHGIFDPPGQPRTAHAWGCLLYTSDAADERG